MEQIKEAIASRLQELWYYSPYNILRTLEAEHQNAFLQTLLSPWSDQKEGFSIFTIENSGHTYHFLYQKLVWDSEYFNFPTYKLFTVVYKTLTFESLTNAVDEFKSHLSIFGKIYCLIEIPAEDIFLIQALTTAGFRVTETRLTYYHDQIPTFESERFAVREASLADVPALRQVASESRNPYDRYHADVFFSPDQADEYLATYAEACVNGLCDTVLVPATGHKVPGAFLAISRLQSDAAILHTSLARIVLTAVGPAHKGWHVKLVSETLQYAKEQGCQYALMTTQATNRAVFRTAEKLGFKLGGTAHMFSINF